jgi:hypothetical protein
VGHLLVSVLVSGRAVAVGHGPGRAGEVFGWRVPPLPRALAGDRGAQKGRLRAGTPGLTGTHINRVCAGHGYQVIAIADIAGA